MDKVLNYHLFLVIWMILAPVFFLLLLFFTAPYGRHIRKGWGPAVPAHRAWMIMEMPAVCLMILFFVLGGRYTSIPLIVFLILWEIHYINRTFIYPLRLSPQSKPMPLSIMVSGLFFNFINGFFIGAGLFVFSRPLETIWLMDPRFVLGLALFIAGLIVNHQSDAILRSIRKTKDTTYRIPQGGFFRWVACPNYLGEILEWGGFALATWSLPALAFFLWSFANLAPRAVSHLRWYRQNFKDCPPGWRAMVPYLF
jgi:protein-S-isoprenylcysteine O-methyltransferase Ste14